MDDSLEKGGRDREWGGERERGTSERVLSEDTFSSSLCGAQHPAQLNTSNTWKS